MENKDIYVLGIETSCDETSAAVVKNGVQILSNVVHSQIKSHERFGGVVPEVASRHHVEMITYVIEEALLQAKMTWEEITCIAITQGPGLVGSLLIGINAAKALALAHEKPLVPVHHISGHIYASALEHKLQYPLMTLVVSGGHTELVYMKEAGSFEVIGETRDDAAGEAYDKVARTLKLPYPGGPQIDKLAVEGSPTYNLPRAWLEPGSYDFSFSGLKSAVINTVHNAVQRGEEIRPADLAASFQESVTDVLVKKALLAMEAYGTKQLVVAGGVAANQGLRKKLDEEIRSKGYTVSIPTIGLCTDNAAMIAAAGYVAYSKGVSGEMSLNGLAGMELKSFGK